MRRSRRHDTAGEQGMALVAVMLLLMTISALGAALAISSTTETMIARNHQTAAEARAAAEAGLSHAAALTLDFLHDSPATYATPTLAMTALLLDTSLAGIDALETGVDLSGPTIRYEATVLDDDDEDGRDIDLEANDLLRMQENGDESLDLNTKIVIRAIGYASGNAVATVEATIAPRSLPAIVTQGDLGIVGSFALGAGASGNVHTNSNLTISGGAAAITGECTSSGTTTGAPASGTCSAGVSAITLPTLEAADYLSRADYILNSNGTYTVVSTSTTTTCGNPCLGAWRWDSGNSEWQITAAGGSPSPTAGTYYVDNPDVTVRISGSPGSVLTPVKMSLIAEGSIVISGGPMVTPESAGLMFVTDEDLSISGGLAMVVDPANPSSLAEGLMLVREQLSVSGGGNKVLRGQIIVRDAAANSSVVTSNVINGNITIQYSGSLDNLFFEVSAWRRSY